MAEVHPGDPSDSVDGRAGQPVTLPYPFECQFCEANFSTLAAYSTHLEVHQTRFDYDHTCPVCERRFVCYDELQLHSRLHANLHPYKCKLCEQPFRLARCLEYHLQSHGGIRVYRCQLCNTREFVELADLHEHLKDHQMGRVQEEEEVEAVFPELKLIMTPTQELEEEDDEVGDENVARVRVGGGTDGAGVQRATAGAQQQQQQHFKSESAKRMAEQEENNSNVPLVDLDEEAVFARAVNVKKTFCNLCNKKMATRKSLNTHYKSVHMKNAHTCSVCRTSFLFSRLLEAHTRKRKQIIPCEFCDLRFCSNKRWSSHIERHQEGSVMTTGGAAGAGASGSALGGAMVMYPRAVPITSSSRPMVSLTNSQQTSTTAINNRQSLLKTNNHHNNNNSSSNHSQLFPTKSNNPASLLLASVTNQPTVNLVNLTDGGNTIGKFPCDACGKIFLSLNYLQAHLVKRGNPNFQFQCDNCEHRFSKKAILEEHQVYHERNPKKVPKLVINKGRVQNGFNGGGGGGGNNNNIFKNSPSNTSAGGENKPTVAGKSSSETPSTGADEEMDYDRHIIRLSDSSFKCNCCHRTFKAVNHLKCHLRYTHMKKNFKCRSCSQQFPFYKLYLAHMKNSKLCERCDKRICAKFDFRIHTQKCRGTAKLRNSTGNMLPIRSSMPTVEIKDDEEEEENDEADEEAEVQRALDDYDDDDVILDENGSHSFATSQLHSSLMLPNTNASTTNESFPSIPHFLMDDLLMDGGGGGGPEDEFRCEVCDKSFAKMTSLHMHSFQHDPNKEMKCIFCNFLFLQRSSLNRHYRCRNTLHTCLTCKESFCSHLNLKQHVCPVEGAQSDRRSRGGGGGVVSFSGNGSSSSAGALLVDDGDYVMTATDPAEVGGGELLMSRKRNRSGQALALTTVAVNSEDVSGRDENIELSDTEPDTDLTCMMCPVPVPFNTKAELDHHVATEHGTVVKCPVCFKAFRSPTILHIHMAARANKRNKIECPSCTHRFNKQSEFRKHFMYHTLKANRPEMSDESIYSRITCKYPGK